MDIDTKGIAAFGQGTYSPLDTLHLTAGIRFDHQILDGDLYDVTSASSCKEELTYDEFLPKFAVAYDVSDDVMAYASVAKGDLVGGFNWIKTPVLETCTYGAEYTWNYELGLKSTWLNGKFLTNLAIFYTKIDDKQVSEYDPETYLNEVTNASSQRSYQTMNLRLGYEEERFDLYLWARNLFDEEYLTYVSPYGKTANVGLDGEPLTVGVTLGMRF